MTVAEQVRPEAGAGLPHRVPVVVVGGGQAGLSLSWYLCRAGIEHLVLERQTIAHEWADARWDTFCLVTPNWQCRLPGWPYSGDDPAGFMVKDEIIEYVRGFAASFDPPVHEGVAVTKLAPAPDGGYLLTTSAGEVAADQVVLAVGGYHLPVVPPYATALPEGITQLHSQQYKNPDQLPDGDVLVVGTGQSGAQIAEDLHLAGRQVHLAVGSAPRIARRYRGREVVEWLDEMGHYDMPVEQHRDGEAARVGTNHYVTGRDGGRDIDLRRFAGEGMQLYGPLTGVRDGTFSFAPQLTAHLDAADRVNANAKAVIDAHIERSGATAPTEPAYVPPWTPESEPTSLDVARIAAVVWAIGFRPDWSWVKVPVFDGVGYPVHARGVTAAPGLFVLGLPWLHTWGSGRFAGIARDAEFVAERIGELVASDSPTGLSRTLAVAAASSAARMA